jgi:hypothetical protein
LPAGSATRALDRIFDSANKFGIRAAYHATVEFDYSERQALRSLEALRGFLDAVLEQHKEARLDQEFVKELRELYERLHRILGD